MDSDFEDEIIDESIAFDSKLDAFYTYERKPFKPSQPLELMNIDVSASLIKK